MMPPNRQNVPRADQIGQIAELYQQYSYIWLDSLETECVGSPENGGCTAFEAACEQ